MEKKLLLQNVYIEYLEEVYTYDEKVRGKRDFYNQRCRWLTTQISNSFPDVSQMPGAILKGNWGYCDESFQWMAPPRVLLLGFIVLMASLLTVLDFTTLIKWWLLLILLGITFSIAAPDYLVDRKFKKAIASAPVLFILMFLNIFRTGGRKFNPTKHSFKS